MKSFECGPVDQEEMSLKDISYLELGWHLCSTELNLLYNSGMHHEE